MQLRISESVLGSWFLKNSQGSKTTMSPLTRVILSFVGLALIGASFVLMYQGIATWGWLLILPALLIVWWLQRKV